MELLPGAGAEGFPFLTLKPGFVRTMRIAHQSKNPHLAQGRRSVGRRVEKYPLIYLSLKTKLIFLRKGQHLSG